MKIYVAGSSKELDRVEGVIARLRSAGHMITHDWTKAVRAAPDDHAITDEHARQCAEADVRGVYDADVVWLLIPEVKSEGAFFELGAAWGWRHPDIRSPRRRLVASGNPTGRIFLWLPGIQRYPDDEAALEAIGWDRTGEIKAGPGKIPHPGDCACVVCTERRKR